MQQFLKCDAPNCDHSESVDDYGPHYIGRPCPLCGESLLTQQDYDDFEPMRLVMEAFSKAGLASDEPGPNSVLLSVNRHNDKTTIEITKPSGNK